MSYQEALELYSAEKYGKALKIFEGLTKTVDPNDHSTLSTIYSNISQIQFKLEMSRKALDSANVAIDQSTNNLNGFIAKANILEMQGQRDSAIKALEVGIGGISAPCDIQLFNRAKEELEGCKTRKEEQIQAKILEKENFEKMRRNARIYRPPEKAVVEPKKVVKKKQRTGNNPITVNFGGEGGKGTSVVFDDANQLDQLEIIQANQYFNEGKLNEAIEIYTKLINDEEIRSAFKCQAHLGRGSCLAQMLKLEESYRDFSQVIQVDEKNIEALKRRGKVRLAMGDFNGAQKDLKLASEALVEKGEEDADVEKEMAVISNKEGKFHDGLKALKKAERILEKKKDPKDKGEKNVYNLSTEIHCIRSHLYNSLGMYMEAEKYAREALKIFSDSRDAYENLAKSMRDQQKYDLAEEYFQKAIAIQPIFTPTYNLVAIMRFFSGDLPGTIDIANKGLAIQEEYSDLLYLKACSYHGLGQFKEAIDWYKKVLKIDKKHWAFYHIDLSKFHQDAFDKPLWSWNLDRHFHSDFKERWGKREPSYSLKYYIKQPDISPKALSLKLGEKLTPQLQQIFDASSLFKSKIQYTSPGFYKNEKQHRQSGIAIIQMAQAAQLYWKAYRNGQTIPISGLANSNGNAEAIPHDFGWRDFYDIAVTWRQVSEPSDPVWWIDMLCEDTFAEGYGAHTPLLMGEARVVRYFQYHDRIIQHMRDLMPQQYSLTGEQKSACFDAKECDHLYQLQRKDFYVHTNCRRLTDKNEKPLEGTRLTIQRDKNGYVLSIRTPCTPERWKMFDAEMELAWRNLAETMRESNDLEQIVKDILVVAFYWYNFMPLVRGSAACGLVSIHALLLAAGLEIKRDIPERLQIDWEAILNPDPESFIDCIKCWFDANVTPVEQGFLESVPNVEQNVDTLRKAFQLLNNGFVIH